MVSGVHLGFSSQLYHCHLENFQSNQALIEWQEECPILFSELIVSWNALRPLKGEYAIYVCLKTDDWSSWLLYAIWGGNGQKSFSAKSQDSYVQVYQDAVETLDQRKARAFKIRVEALEGADLRQFHSLHACTTDLQALNCCSQVNADASISLKVAGISQMTLQHQRCKDMCSPTSTTAVVRYLKSDPLINPVEFARLAHDDGFDIYGNWVFNVAQAYTYLGRKWQCFVARLSGFDDIYKNLSEGTPVVISIRGPLKGSPLLYKSGHLIAIIGFDSETNEVLCMDPAFSSDENTIVRYALDDLMKAWGRRLNIAYMFNQLEIPLRLCAFAPLR